MWSLQILLIQQQLARLARGDKVAGLGPGSLSATSSKDGAKKSSRGRATGGGLDSGASALGPTSKPGKPLKVVKGEEKAAVSKSEKASKSRAEAAVVTKWDPKSAESKVAVETSMNHFVL